MHRRIAWIASFLCCMSGAVAIAAQSPDASPPRWSAVRNMHADYVRAFVESEGFGMRRITPMMLLMQSSILILDGKSMRVGDVQLIGIAKHDPPVVHAGGFMAFQHGDADQEFLPRPATRRIDDRERLILRDLQEGQEVVTAADVSGSRAFGAIRATSPCLQCHRSKHAGDLLGVLVYHLEPAQK